MSLGSRPFVLRLLSLLSGEVAVDDDGSTVTLLVAHGAVPPTAAATAGMMYIDQTAGRFYFADGSNWLYVSGTVYVPPAATHPVGMITRLTGMAVPGRRV